MLVFTCALGIVWLTMLFSGVFSGDEIMASEERQPMAEEWSWSSTISGEDGERWTPDTKKKKNNNNKKDRIIKEKTGWREESWNRVKEKSKESKNNESEKSRFYDYFSGPNL